MADEARIGVPDRRTAADKDDTAGKARKRRFGVHAGAQHEQFPICAGEIWNAGDRSGAGSQHVTPGDVEEAGDVRLIVG